MNKIIILLIIINIYQHLNVYLCTQHNIWKGVLDWGEWVGDI
jgi:hypothetical protein